MQVMGLPLSSSAWEGLETSAFGGNAQEKMRRLMDLPATDDLGSNSIEELKSQLTFQLRF